MADRDVHRLPQAGRRRPIVGHAGLTAIVVLHVDGLIGVGHVNVTSVSKAKVAVMDLDGLVVREQDDIPIQHIRVADDDIREGHFLEVPLHIECVWRQRIPGQLLRRLDIVRLDGGWLEDRHDQLICNVLIRRLRAVDVEHDIVQVNVFVDMQNHSA
ncbi:hypothetical protein D3C76_1264830 [compost metagenome]